MSLDSERQLRIAYLLCVCVALAKAVSAQQTDSTVRLTVAHQHFGSWCLGYLYVNPSEVWYEVASPDRFKGHAFRVQRSQINAHEWIFMAQPQNAAELKFGRSTYHFWLLCNQDLATTPVGIPQQLAMSYQILVAVIAAGGNPAAQATPAGPANQSATPAPDGPAAPAAPTAPGAPRTPAASLITLSLPGSIVYSKAGNLWISDASGASKRPLTTDGGYRSPSMADDGTIGAIRDEASGTNLLRLSPSGGVLSRVPVPPAGGQIVVAKLSPNGAMFGLVYSPGSPSPCAYPSGVPYNPLGALQSKTCVGVVFTPSDHWEPVIGSPRITPHRYYDVYWLDNTQAISPNSNWIIQRLVPGMGPVGYFHIIDNLPLSLSAEPLTASISRDGQFIVTIRLLHTFERGATRYFPPQILMGRVLPGDQVQVLGNAPVNGIPSNVSFSPDGKYVAVAMDDTVHVLSLTAETHLVIDSQAREPYWGAFPYASASNPATQPANVASTTPEDLLADALASIKKQQLHFRQTGDLAGTAQPLTGAREKAQSAYEQFLAKKNYAKAARSLIAVADLDRMLAMQNTSDYQVKQAPIKQKYADALKLANRLFDALGSNKADSEQVKALQAKVDALQAQNRALEAKIQQRAPKLAAPLGDKPPVSLESVQAAARRNNYDLLYYLSLDYDTLIWHIGGDSVHVVEVRFSREQLADRIAALRMSLSDPHSTFNDDLATQLFRVLVNPVLPYIRTHHLVIVPHQDLMNLPFQVLRNVDDGSYLGVKFQISYARPARPSSRA